MIPQLAATIAVGLFLGKLVVPRRVAQSPMVGQLQTVLMVAMLLALGMRLGIQQATTPAWAAMFTRSLVLAAGTIAGSIAFTWPCASWLPPLQGATAQVALPNPLRLLSLAIGSLVVGAVAGVVLPAAIPLEQLETAALGALMSMLLLVGLEGGSKESVGANLRSLSPRLLLVPVVISVGSAVGGCAAGILLGFAARDGAAIGAGCGWYSFTTILVGNHSGPEMGSYGLLANLFREALSLLVIPVMARWHRGLVLLAPAGCTSMDTTFQMLRQLGGERLGLLAFLTGAICSLLVPFLVPFAFAHIPGR